MARTAQIKNSLSDSSIALQCSFWVWLRSLSGCFAVDTKACSAALLYAHPAMTRVCFKARADSKAASLSLPPTLIYKSRLGGVKWWADHATTCYNDTGPTLASIHPLALRLHFQKHHQAARPMIPVHSPKASNPFFFHLK